MSDTRQPRVLAFDVMNILAILAVVTLHHNGLVHSFRNSLAWKQSLVAECLFYWAVPVFLMISGANLLGYRSRYSTKVFFQKRVLRTLVPWLAWSVIFLIWKTASGQIVMESYSVVSILNMIFTYKVESVYWFFGTLFGCYLAMPVISLAQNRRTLLWYVVWVNFIFCSCLPALTVFTGLRFSIEIPLAVGSFIYIPLGYLLKDGVRERPKRIALYLAGISCVVFRFCYTLQRSVQSGQTDTSVKGYRMFHAVLFSAAVFVFLRQVNWDRILPQKIKNALPVLSGCSFGVFLIHRQVMYYETALFHTANTSLFWRSGAILITYVLSVCIVLLLKKIPVVRYIMG